MSREATFTAAQFPTNDDLEALRRELRARSSRANYVHCDILWRLRQGETVTAERMGELFPMLKDKIIDGCITDLRLWGYVAAAGAEPALILQERVA